MIFQTDSKLTRLMVVGALTALLVTRRSHTDLIKILDSEIPGFTVGAAIGSAFWILLYTLASVAMFHYLRGAKTTRVMFLHAVDDLIRLEPTVDLSQAVIAPNPSSTVASRPWVALARERVDRESSFAERLFKGFHYYLPIYFGIITTIYSAPEGIKLLILFLSRPFELLSYLFVRIFGGQL
jgi:hypothetical protein